MPSSRASVAVLSEVAAAVSFNPSFTRVTGYAPDEPMIRSHLLHCLEAHYGDLSSAVAKTDDATRLLREIARMTEGYRG